MLQNFVVAPEGLDEDLARTLTLTGLTEDSPSILNLFDFHGPMEFISSIHFKTIFDFKIKHAYAQLTQLKEDGFTDGGL